MAYTTKKIEELLDNPDISEEDFDKYSEQLRQRNPYHDMFHLGCPNWPNCDEGGCGEY